jgi:hypothetical protein
MSHNAFNKNLLAIGKLAVGITCLTLAGLASAAETPIACNGECTWSANVGGGAVELGGVYDLTANGDVANLQKTSTTGRANPDGSFSWAGNGAAVSILNVSGNSDPILGFSVAASTGASAQTFAFTFNLPVAISGPIASHSKVSYSLTANSAAGAQIQPLSGHTVIAQEVDTTVGGLSPLNKNVDVGDTFFFTGGPNTINSPVYEKFGSLTGNLQYDMMSVTLTFSLSANSSVGVSGFVEQTAVPVPAAAWLMGSALAGLFGVRRRARA